MVYTRQSNWHKVFEMVVMRHCTMALRRNTFEWQTGNTFTIVNEAFWGEKNTVLCDQLWNMLYRILLLWQVFNKYDNNKIPPLSMCLPWCPGNKHVLDCFDCFQRKKTQRFQLVEHSLWTSTTADALFEMFTVNIYRYTVSQ